MKHREVSCPSCKKKFNYYDSEFRPFCTERCRLIDLGQWLTESYSVPAEKLTPDEIDTLENLYEKENNKEESSDSEEDEDSHN